MCEGDLGSGGCNPEPDGMGRKREKMGILRYLRNKILWSLHKMDKCRLRETNSI